MNILLLMVLTATINTSALIPLTEQKFLNPNAMLRQLFEIMRQTIKQGSPENNVPVLDPMIFLREEVTIQTRLISMGANLTNGVIRGLGDYQLNHIEFNRDELAIVMGLTISKLTIESDYYEMDGFLFDKLPLFGKGELRFEIKNLEISCKAFLRPSENSKSTLIDNFENFRFDMKEIASHTEFGDNVDCIINKILKDVLASYFTRFNKYIAKIYSPQIKKILNPFLDKFDSWRIISTTSRFLAQAKHRMKIAIILLVAAVATAAPNTEVKQDVFDIDVAAFANASPENRNFLINQLIRQIFNIIRIFIRDGSALLGLPPLDPLVVDNLHLDVPAGLINLDLQLADVLVTGLGGFIVHKSDLKLSDLSFDIDISVPRLTISAGHYDLTGDLLTAIPLYGDGKAEFIVEGFRFQAKLFLKQSTDNDQATVIDRIENLSFQLPHFESKLSGVIGGGDIDGIVNSVVEEVIIDYVNRFQGAISKLASNIVLSVLNPVLNQLNSWPWIAAILPRP
ncbi:unnamed protein product [Colias eurytheme]|nr:unnamed protein product [Colias eurytheme]